MKRWLLIILVLVSASSFAQPYGNEWINYSQSYLKIPITANGVYRLDSATLDQAYAKLGLSINSIDPRQIQLFGREKEIALLVEGESDGVVNGGDYVEFYAEGNDGWFDTLIYDDPSSQANPYFSLLNDTIHYYLTYSQGNPGLRVTQETDVNFSAFTAIDYFWSRKFLEYHQRFLHGEINNDVSLSYTTAGEGYFRAPMGVGGSNVFQMPTRDAYANGPNARCFTTVANSNNPLPAIPGGPNHGFYIDNATPNVIYGDTAWAGYELINFSFELPAANLGSNVSNFRVVNNGTAQSNPRINVGHFTIDYPHAMELGASGTSIKMTIPNHPSENKSYLPLTGFTGANPHMYVLGDVVRRLPLVPSTGGLDVLVPNNTNGPNSTALLFDESTISFIDQAIIEKVTASGFFTDYSQLGVDSAFLMITHSRFWNESLQYAAYRDSRGANSVLANVDELYHQYGAGIVQNPFAIRRFVDMTIHEFPTKPAFLFLIGKSIRHSSEAFAPNGARLNPSAYAGNFVPTLGSPGCDVCLVADLDGNRLDPAVPIGRLAVRTPNQLSEYLAKVQEYEQVLEGPREDWMKQVIHFGGGASAFEQTTFRGYLESYESTLRDTCVGANVHTFLKTTSNPIQINLSDSVRTLIERGVSLMTFFGHASGSGFDQALDDPSAYNNKGKYPLLVGNSCFTGDLHQPGEFESTSEDFVLIPDKGVIGFVSSTKLGIASNLHQYSTLLMRNMAFKQYGKTIGEMMQQTSVNMDDIYFSGSPDADFWLDNVLMSMTLHGDPSIVPYSSVAPDYSIKPENVFFTPSIVTGDVDSFTVSVDMTNLGKAVLDSFEVRMIHRFPSGADSTYTQTFSNLLYRDTVSFKIGVDDLNHIGLNTFDVQIDLPSFVDEIPNFDVVNNQVFSKNLVISRGGIFPVFPYDFAIVPDDKITLKASTGDPFAPVSNYIFEIDTTDEFNSPFKISSSVSHAGGVIKWTPTLSNGDTLTLTDSTVYFWRVTADTIWRESSFQYISGKSGWGQAHFFQYKNNNYNIVEYQRSLTNRSFGFAPRTATLTADVVGNPNSATFGDTQYKIDLEFIDDNGCGVAPAIHVVVIDSVTLEPWRTFGFLPGNPGIILNADRQYGNLNNGPACRGRTEGYFNFRQNIPAQMQALDSMLNHVVPDGNHLLVYSWVRADYDLWQQNEPNLFNTFASMGADSVGQGQDSVPFIFYTIKGDPSSTVEVYGQTGSDLLKLSQPMHANFTFGTVTTPLAGPAASWNSLHWDERSLEAGSDSTVIRLIGVKASGQDTLLAEFAANLDSVPNLDQYINASEYPFAKLQAFTRDDSTVTPSQLVRWQLLYDPVPEAALNPAIGLTFSADSLQEGNTLDYAISIENVSNVPMDSMLVSYWVEDADRVRTDLQYARQKPLLPGEVLFDTIEVKTNNLVGSNFIWVEANPINPATGNFDQLEQYRFNNVAVRSFKVSEDRINPILDVTFDGIHIMDGEVVSPKPFVAVTLDDENPFIIMNELADTANFQLFLKSPDGNLRTLRFLSSSGEELMRFVPADAVDNKSRIEITPELIQDGMYELIVRANDKSGNESGDLEYRINFEVINRSTITDVLNYPNPFSTSTRFLFTLTGSEPPTYFKIQIMTVSGRVVREIFQDELGPLRIGRNISEFAWDGTDQFGDQLANGVYLYRVIVKDQNFEDVELRESGASKWISKGFGKMYLLR